MNMKPLKIFADNYGCDGFREIEIVEVKKDYAVLRFVAWDGNEFKLKVVDIQ